MRENAQRDIFKTLINNRLGATAICNIVEKVSLCDTVWGNYSYLANGIKKGHKTARPPQGFARPDEITGCLVPKRHGTTYRVFVISSSLRLLYASNAHQLPEHSYHLGKKNAVFMSRYAEKHII